MGPRAARRATGCSSGCGTPGRGRPTSRSWRCRCRTGTPHSLTRGIYARYAPTGHLLVVTADGKLIAIPFDPKKLELTGAPVALIEGIGVRAGGFNIDLALAAQRHPGLHHRRHARLPARGLGEPRGRRRARWTRPGTRRASSNRPACLPDGKAVAVGLSRDGRRDIWVKQLPDGPFSRITFGDTSSVRPAWSPDGRDVLYITDRSGSGVGPVYAHRADGTGVAAPAARLAKARLRPDRALARRPLAAPPDRRRSAAGSADILGLKAGDTTLGPAGRHAGRGAVTRRSRRTAAGWRTPRTNRGDRRSTSGRSPRPATAKWQVSTAGGSEPAWSQQRPGAVLHQRQGARWCRPRSRRAPRSRSGEQRTLFSVAQLVRGRVRSRRTP